MQATLPSRRQIDRYELLAPIGEGGFGSVFRARHIHAGHFVALKLVRDDGHGGVARLLREARALAEIQHPNVVRVFDCGIVDGEAFVAMELAEGQDLSKVLEAGPMPPARAVAIAQQVLSGLAVVHARGIVHRDVKPANISLGPSDQVKLLDFGISKSSRVETVTHTRPGSSIGTPGYMAPEQLGATVEVDPRADVYAVAATLYEMLSGRRPHDAPSYEDYVVKVRTERPPPLASVAPHVPAALADVIDRGLARDRDARWPSATAFSEALASAMATGFGLQATGGVGAPATRPSGPPIMSAPPTGPARTPPPPPLAATPSKLPVVALAMGGLAILVAFGIAIAAFLYVRSKQTAFVTPPAADSAPVNVPVPVPVPASASATATASATVAPSATATAAPISTLDPRPSTHVTPTGAAGVKVSAPRITGQVKIAVLDDLIARAMPSLPKCRRAGKAETVVVQVFVQDSGEVSMVQPYVAENKGDVETAQCVSTRILDASQHGWNSKGSQGIVRYTVTLDAL